MSKEKPVIFVVDDDETNLMTYQNALSEKYETVTLQSGELLFKILEKRVPDLIVLDVDMPVLGGFGVIMKLKKNDKHKDIPVIFLTAYSDSESEKAAFNLGAADFVTKSFNVQRLLDCIQNHLEYKELEESA